MELECADNCLGMNQCFTAGSAAAQVMLQGFQVSFLCAILVFVKYNFGTSQFICVNPVYIYQYL
jgi:hypothetical protein